jgi:polysaccharide export outer membrane protein
MVNKNINKMFLKVKQNLKEIVAKKGILFCISFFIFHFSIIISLPSCTTYKQLQYLQGDFDSTKYAQFKVPEQRAQKGDQISINVFSDNASASAPFNTGSLASSAGSPQQSLSNGAASLGSYEVDKDGNIFFPVLGLLHIEGLTKEGMSNLFDSKLKGTYLNNPYYVIRFQNLKFTVFGEVGSPGVYPLTRNNLNIFEALTYAGDLSVYGKRENILVIRENNGKREFGRVNITKPDVFNSPYYYLQQNDMILVDMNKQKALNGDQAVLRNLSLVLTLITTLSFVFNIFK